ncbi:hypothetical protein H3147_23800 [Streptomyces sp. OF8]|uniref:Uncharacterized protein n=1 Tax=Streptomyces alkaliterrae TaxID=2213162 RepID=A0A7W3X0T7_9ACTN|nr:hypothetical protein [Streptomyces alkaliterrae]
MPTPKLTRTASSSPPPHSPAPPGAAPSSTRSSRVVEYVHLDLAGEPKVEEREVLSETLESVRCRWCNAVDQVELVDRPGAQV